MIDEESSPSSSNLFSLINEDFKCFSDGSVRDSHGHFHTVWKIIDFQRWWLSFESHAGIPLGRKLMNAATDEEEYFLNESSLLDIGWFMKKRRIESIVHRRWKTKGWGLYSHIHNTVFSHLLAPLCSGFALATLEMIKSQRFKVQWRQVSNVQIQLETDDDNRSLSLAPAPPNFYWQTLSSNFEPIYESGLSLDLHASEYGWSHSGEQSFLLPVGVLQRLFESVNMQGLQIVKEAESWEFPDDFKPSDALLIRLSSLAMNDMVSLSERPIYIQDLASWGQLVEAHLKPFGLGSFVEVRSLDEQGGVEFELTPSSLLPHTIGILIAFWQRGIGRKAKIKVMLKNENWVFQVTSFLAYAV